MPNWPKKAHRLLTVRDKISAEIAAAKKTALDAGGLYVVEPATGSRRIDNQLWPDRPSGDLARQGTLSLQDDRCIGLKTRSMLLKLGRKGGRLSTRGSTRPLKRPRPRLSGQFEIRKQLLKYDDVMDDQRQVIRPAQRYYASHGVHDTVIDMRHGSYVDCRTGYSTGSFNDQWDASQLDQDAQRVLNVAAPIGVWFAEDGLLTPKSPSV